MAKYHKDEEVYLITGKQLNLSIWAIEQMMDLFVNNSDMLKRLGRLRDELIKKISYMELLDKLGIPNAPPQEDLIQDSFTDFLNSLGLKPSENKDDK